MDYTLTGREWYAVVVNLEETGHPVTANWLLRLTAAVNPDFLTSDDGVTVSLPTWPATRVGRITGVIYRIHGRDKAQPDEFRGIDPSDLLAMIRG